MLDFQPDAIPARCQWPHHGRAAGGLAQPRRRLRVRSGWAPL